MSILNDINEMQKHLIASAPVLPCPHCGGEVKIIRTPPAGGRCASCGHHCAFVIIDLDMPTDALAANLALVINDLRRNLQQ